jgi:hypothetical protein
MTEAVKDSLDKKIKCVKNEPKYVCIFYIQTYLGSFLTHLITFKGDQKRKRYNLSQIFSVAKLLHENCDLIVLDLNVMHKI